MMDIRRLIHRVIAMAVASAALSAPAFEQSATHIGDFDGDGRADAMYISIDGMAWMYRWIGTSMQRVNANPSGVTGEARFLKETNADLRTDVIWQQQDGRTWHQILTGVYNYGGWELQPAGGTSRLQQLADFDGNGHADYVWKHGDGSVEMRLMRHRVPQQELLASRLLQPAGSAFTAELAADFNGDGKADILWSHPDGRRVVWLMNGLNYTASLTILPPGSTATPRFVGDFNGDGKDDLIFELADGSTTVWLMDGVNSLSRRTMMGTGTNWRVTAVGDLDGDGKTDVIWRNTAYGNFVAWLMNGETYTASRTLRGPNTEWRIGGLGDFDGDGRADIFWTTNFYVGEIWLMNGLDATFQVGFSPHPSDPAIPWAVTDHTLEFPASAMQGESVTLKATMTSAAGTPTGVVLFQMDQLPIPGCEAAPLVNGVATCVTPPLTAGDHAVGIWYQGDIGFWGTGSGRGISVLGSPTVTLLTGPATATAGTPVTFTAAASGGSGTFTGHILFYANGLLVSGCNGVQPTVAGVSQCTTSLGVGTYTIYAHYGGDPANNASWSNPLMHTVAPAAPLPLRKAWQRRDFDGDGNEDLTNTLEDGTWWVVLMNGGTTKNVRKVREPEKLSSGEDRWTISHIADFNADGKADIVWLDRATGSTELWLMDGLFATSVHALGRGYARLVGDFNADGRADLIVEDTAAAGFEMRLMDGGTVLQSSVILPYVHGFRPQHAGTFCGFGNDGLIMAHADGRHVMWTFNGVQRIMSRTLQGAGPWRVEKVADFNGDNCDDIAWHNTADSRTTLWLMMGTSTLSERDLQGPGSAWRIAGAADFNGDGKADLLWRNQTYGNTVMWLMDGVSYIASRTLRGPGFEWVPWHLGDLNGDGRADILWAQYFSSWASGQAEYWPMNGVDAGPIARTMGGLGYTSPVKN